MSIELKNYHTFTREPGRGGDEKICSRAKNGCRKILVRHDGKVYRYDVPARTSLVDVRHAISDAFQDGCGCVRVSGRGGDFFVEAS